MEEEAVPPPEPIPPVISDAGRESWPPGLHPQAGVDLMRAWLREHNQPIYGTKETLWRRLILKNHHILREQIVSAELAKQLEARREGQPVQPAIQLQTPYQPTQAERDDHELTHAKFAPWCEYCIMGKGTEAAHRAVSAADREPAGPRIEFDFAHMKADGSFFEDGEEYDYSTVLCTHLVGVDCGNGALFCVCIDLSGPNTASQRYGIEMAKTFINTKGYRKVTLRYDGEPALVALMERLRDSRAEETALQQTPFRSSQSLGIGERGVSTMKE